MVRKGLICPFNIWVMNIIKSTGSKVVALAMTFKICFSYNTTVFYYLKIDKWVNKPYSESHNG